MKLIEFEGVDGVGKSTAYNYVANQLENKGYRVLKTREVGSPHIPQCKALREIVLSLDYDMDGRAMEFIFAAMRLENQKFYDSVKNEYDFILSDRGWFSHLAYTDHNVNEDFTKKFYLGLVSNMTYKPDYVFYLHASPSVAKERLKGRGDPVDAIEKKGSEFQKKVSDSFDKYLLDDSDINFMSIDANKDIKGTQRQLDEVLQIIIKENEL